MDVYYLNIFSEISFSLELDVYVWYKMRFREINYYVDMETKAMKLVPPV